MKKLSYIYLFTFLTIVFSTQLQSAESENSKEVTYEIAEDDILFGLLQGIFGQSANIIVGGELPSEPDHIITTLSEALNKSLTSLILVLVIFRFIRWVVAIKSQGGGDIFDFQHAPFPIFFALIAIIPVKGGVSFLQMVTIQVAGYSIKISNYETNIAADFLGKYGSYSSLTHLANVEENVIATIVGSVCKGIINKQDRHSNVNQNTSTSFYEHDILGEEHMVGNSVNGFPITRRDVIETLTYVNNVKFNRSGVYKDKREAEEYNEENALSPSSGRMARSYADDVCGNSQLTFPELKTDDNYSVVGAFRNEVADHYSLLNIDLSRISSQIVNKTYAEDNGKYSHMDDEIIEEIREAVSRFKIGYQDALATLVSQYAPSNTSESNGLNSSTPAEMLREKGTAYLGVYYFEFIKKNKATLEATKLSFTHKMPNSKEWDYFYINSKTKTAEGLVRIIKSLKNNVNADLPSQESALNKQIRLGHEKIEEMVSGDTDDMWQIPTKLVVGTTSYIMENLMEENDPVSGLINTGHNLIVAMESFYVAAQLASIKIKFTEKVAEATKEIAEGAASDTPFLGGTAEGVVQASWVVISQGFTFVQDTLDLAKYLMLPILLAGIFLAFWLPAIPMIHWINTMIGFLIVTFNTFILVPALAISHLITTDNKMLGQKTNHGYMAIVQLLLYLPIVVISFFGSVLILMAGAKLIQLIFIPMMLSIIGNTLSGLVTLFFFIFLFLGINIQMFNRCFALISGTPEKLNEYIGGGAEMLDDKEGVGGTKAIVTNMESSTKESVSTARMQNRGGKGAEGEGAKTPTQNAKNNLNKSVT